MKILKRLMLVAFAGAMLAACSKDLETVDPEGPNEGSETVDMPKVMRTFSLTTSDMTASDADTQFAATRAEEDADEAISFGLQPATRATTEPATADEKTIVKVAVLQFDGSTDASLLQLNETFDSSAISTTDGKTTVSVPLLDMDGSVIYVIANVDAAETNKLVVGTSTLKNFKESSFAVKAFAAADLKSKGIPMMGSCTSADFSANNEAEVSLSFLFAKIKLNISAAMPSGSSFNISSVQLMDVPNSVPVVAPETTTIKISSGPSVATGFNNITFYAPENKRGTVAGLTAQKKSWWTCPEGAMYVQVNGAYTKGSTNINLTYLLYLGANATTDFNVVRNSVYTITPTIKGINSSDLRVSRATVVDLSASATANCYMVNEPAKTYRFKATVQGNGATTPATNGITNGTVTQNATEIKPVAIAPKSMKVLWETGSASAGYVIRAARLYNDQVYFSTAGAIDGTVREANALVAVSTAATTTETNVAWSWHIWSTAYNPNADYRTYVTRNISNTSYNSVPQRNEKVMIHNLGAATNSEANAAAFGLLYQWGRKDPFVGASSHEADTKTYAVSTKGQSWATGTLTGTTAANIASAISHPTTFYLQRNTSQYDWLGDTYANQRDNLWGNPNTSTKTPNPNRGSKSIYDPCPPGWRVAPQDTWTRFTTHGYNTSTSSEFNVSGSFNFGWNFIYSGADKTGMKVYYPAAGLRHYSTGALTNVGTYGYYWSSSSYYAGSNHAGNLNFHSGSVYPLDNAHRANGRSVRCVQE